MTGDAAVEAVLAALADPTRRHVLDLLAGADGLSATAVADQLPVTRQAVVKHLAVLDQAGLVSAQRAGREVRYVARPEPLTSAAMWLEDLARRWHGESAAPATDPAAVAAAPAEAPTPSAPPEAPERLERERLSAQTVATDVARAVVMNMRAAAELAEWSYRLAAHHVVRHMGQLTARPRA